MTDDSQLTPSQVTRRAADYLDGTLVPDGLWPVGAPFERIGPNEDGRFQRRAAGRLRGRRGRAGAAEHDADDEGAPLVRPAGSAGGDPVSLYRDERGRDDGQSVAAPPEPEGGVQVRPERRLHDPVLH